MKYPDALRSQAVPIRDVRGTKKAVYNFFLRGVAQLYPSKSRTLRYKASKDRLSASRGVVDLIA